jgi:hypothetical protein
VRCRISAFLAGSESRSDGGPEVRVVGGER